MSWACGGRGWMRSLLWHFAAVSVSGWGEGRALCLVCNNPSCSPHPFVPGARGLRTCRAQIKPYVPVWRRGICESECAWRAASKSNHPFSQRHEWPHRQFLLTPAVWLLTLAVSRVYQKWSHCVPGGGTRHGAPHTVPFPPLPLLLSSPQAVRELDGGEEPGDLRWRRAVEMAAPWG